MAMHGEISSAAPVRLDLLIGSDDVGSVRTFDVHDPGRLTNLVGVVATGTVGDIDCAVRTAQRTFVDWWQAPVRERIERLISLNKTVNVTA
jgi:delta 1-pyrroline-5-carboxylate dehydrogenase